MQFIPETSQRPHNLSWVFKVVWEVHSDVVTVLCLISISLQSRFKDIIVLIYSGFTDSENGVLWSPCV